MVTIHEIDRGYEPLSLVAEEMGVSLDNKLNMALATVEVSAAHCDSARGTIAVEQPKSVLIALRFYVHYRY